MDDEQYRKDILLRTFFLSMILTICTCVAFDVLGSSATTIGAILVSGVFSLGTGMLLFFKLIDM